MSSSSNRESGIPPVVTTYRPSIIPATRYMLPIVPPWKPGECPFHVRGAQYMQSLRMVRDQAGNKYQRVMDLLPTEELREYFQQEVKHSAWYDDCALSYLYYAHGKMLGLAPPRAMYEAGEWQARTMTDGMFSFALKTTGSVTTSKSLQHTLAFIFRRVLTFYTDFGAVSDVAVEDDYVDLTVSGIPRYDLGGWQEVCRGFITYILTTRIGRTNSVVQYSEPTLLEEDKKQVYASRYAFNLRFSW